MIAEFSALCRICFDDNFYGFKKYDKVRKEMRAKHAQSKWSCFAMESKGTPLSIWQDADLEKLYFTGRRDGEYTAIGFDFDRHNGESVEMQATTVALLDGFGFGQFGFANASDRGLHIWFPVLTHGISEEDREAILSRWNRIHIRHKRLHENSPTLLSQVELKGIPGTTNIRQTKLLAKTTGWSAELPKQGILLKSPAYGGVTAEKIHAFQACLNKRLSFAELDKCYERWSAYLDALPEPMVPEREKLRTLPDTQHTRGGSTGVVFKIPDKELFRILTGKPLASLTTAVRDALGSEARKPTIPTVKRYLTAYLLLSLDSDDFAMPSTRIQKFVQHLGKVMGAESTFQPHAQRKIRDACVRAGVVEMLNAKFFHSRNKEGRSYAMKWRLCPQVSESLLTHTEIDLSPHLLVQF